MFTYASLRRLATLTVSLVLCHSAFAATPKVIGQPQAAVRVGNLYDFRPAVSGAGSATVRFQIAHKPAWLSFNPNNGRLYATPGKTNVGRYSNIVISATVGKSKVSLPAFSITVWKPNRAPSISGTPLTRIDAGAVYAFQPAARDADGNKLTFSVQNKPQWATFDAATGRLSGKPTAATVHAGITISVSDGKASATLAPFQVLVSRPPLTATLRWVAPAMTIDGKPLANLVGYRVVYGTRSDALDQTLELPSTELTSVSIEDLQPGTYYFAVKAYTAAGTESDLSDMVSKTFL